MTSISAGPPYNQHSWDPISLSASSSALHLLYTSIECRTSDGMRRSGIVKKKRNEWFNHSWAKYYVVHLLRWICFPLCTLIYINYNLSRSVRTHGVAILSRRRTRLPINGGRHAKHSSLPTGVTQWYGLAQHTHDRWDWNKLCKLNLVLQSHHLWIDFPKTKGQVEKKLKIYVLRPQRRKTSIF